MKKGDLVLLFTNYDRKGTVRITKAEVRSCGRQQMVLTLRAPNAAVCLGKNFRPCPEQYDHCIVLEDMADEAAERTAVGLAEEIVARERARLVALAADPTATPAYRECMRKNIAELHAPVVTWSTQATFTT